MDLLFPVAHMLCESAAKTIDKLNFRRNHIQPTHLMRLVFIGMSLSLGLYIFLFRPTPPTILSVSVGLLLLIVAISFAGNVFDFISLKYNDLSLREPMLGFEPILAGLIGYLIFPSERKSSFLIAFMISIFIVYFGTHRRKLKKIESKGMIFLLIAVLLYAVLPSFYKLALEYVSPVYLSFIRTVGVLALSSIFLPIKKHTRSARKIGYGLTSGVIYALGTVTSLYAVDRLGVAQTMLLFLLSPALVYLSSYFILREKVRTGEVMSSILLAIIVFVAIAY